MTTYQVLRGWAGAKGQCEGAGRAATRMVDPTVVTRADKTAVKSGW
jgi:hypothetical protein